MNKNEWMNGMELNGCGSFPIHSGRISSEIEENNRTFPAATLKPIDTLKFYRC